MAESKVKLNVDTGPAKRGEKELKRARRDARRKKTRQAGRTRGMISRRVGQGLGIAVFNRMTASRPGDFDIWEDSLTVDKANAQALADKAFGGSAIARTRARELTKENLRGIGASNKLNLEIGLVKDVFKMNLGFMEEEERGRNILRQNQKLSTHKGGAAILIMMGAVADLIDGIARIFGGHDDDLQRGQRKK